MPRELPPPAVVSSLGYSELKRTRGVRSPESLLLLLTLVFPSSVSTASTETLPTIDLRVGRLWDDAWPSAASEKPSLSGAEVARRRGVPLQLFESRVSAILGEVSELAAALDPSEREALGEASYPSMKGDAASLGAGSRSAQ